MHQNYLRNTLVDELKELNVSHLHLMHAIKL